MNTVAKGNATEFISYACTGKDSCDYFIDVRVLGDSAPRCGKDFSVSWQCGLNAPVETASLPGEAHRKTISLDCAGTSPAMR
jgi:hypothetical protein